MQLYNSRLSFGPAAGIPGEAGWSVEIHLSPGGVVRERAIAGGPREAIEAALARSYILPAQVCGISAHPIESGRAA